MHELTKRLVVAKNWKWLKFCVDIEGLVYMGWQEAYTDDDGEPWEAGHLFMSERISSVRSQLEGDSFPDLTNAATVGLVMGMAHKQMGPNACIEPYLAMTPEREIRYRWRYLMGPRINEGAWIEGNSPLEAAIAALEGEHKRIKLGKVHLKLRGGVVVEAIGNEHYMGKTEEEARKL